MLKTGEVKVGRLIKLSRKIRRLVKCKRVRVEKETHNCDGCVFNKHLWFQIGCETMPRCKGVIFVKEE